jgi:heptosyltransferase-2
MMKLLLVQTSWLGDTILSTPVIAGIKSIYPDAELWMMTTRLSADLVRRDPLLAGNITYDKRGRDSGVSGFMRTCRRVRDRQFQRAYSLHKSYRTALLLFHSRIPVRIGFENAHLKYLYHLRKPRPTSEHDVIRNLSILAGESPVETLDTSLRLFPPGSEDAPPLVKDIISNTRDFVIMVPGSAWATKMWPWEGYRQVAAHLRRQQVKVVLLGASAEVPVAERVARGLDVINLAGKTSISEAMLLVSRARLMVCNDSMALHLASAFQVPTVAVFCSTSPEFGFGPWQNRAIVVQRDDLPCKPCGPHGFKRCPNDTQACMQDLPASQVIEAVDTLLN